MSQAPPTSPYPGLAPLRAADAGRFHGRRRLTHRVLSRLQEPRRFLALVGPPGCGKTSLVQAGLVPALSGELGDKLLILHIDHPSLDALTSLQRQGLVHPEEDLALSLRERARQSGARRVLLVLDHAEELLLLAPATQRNLVDQLLLLTQPGEEPETLLLWIARGDCLCALAALSPRLPSLLECSTLLLPGTLELAEWTAMVQEPARHTGVTIEPSLIDALARDLAALAPGQTEGRPCEAVLPLLAATLERLWEGLLLRPGATSLSAADYQGGAVLARALALTAESVWQALPLRLQPMARRLLLLLVHPLPVSGGTLLLPRPRREEELLALLAPSALLPPSGSGQLAADSPARQAADALVRLLTAGLLRREDGVIELASAALLGEWKELGRWPEEERRFVAWHKETLALVQREGSRPSLPMGMPGSLPGASLPGVAGGTGVAGVILQGGKLAEAERWLAERGSQIDPKLVRLIVSGVTQRDRRAAQSGQLTPGAPRRLTWALAILVVLLCGGLVAQWQRQKARRADGYFQLDSERGARAALLVQQPGQDGAALALAISAAAPSLRSGRKTPPLAKDGLMLTYSAAKISRPLHGHSDSVEMAVFDPSGQRVLTGSRDQTARLWNARTGEPLVVLSGHSGMITSVNFSPDGSLALTTSNDGTARIWDSQTGALRWVLKGHGDRVQMAVFSPLGDRVVTASHDHSARIWDSRTGQQVAMLSGHSEPVIVAAFLPSGRAVLTASFDKTVRLWDSQTGALLKVLCRHTNRVNLVAVSPDGERVVTGSWDQTALLWHLGPTGTPVGGARVGGSAATVADTPVVLDHGSPLHALAIAPSGDYIATTGTDGVVKLWDGHTGALRARFVGHSGVVDGLGFSPSSQHLISAGHDRTVRLWDVRTEQNIAVLRGHSNSVYTAAFAPSGAEAVTASYDKTARIWDVRSGTPLAILQGHTRPIASAVFSPDGTRIATAGYDYTARLWRWPGGEPLAVMNGHRHLVNCVAFSPDGDRVATSSTDADVRLWDGHTGQLLKVLSGHNGAVFTLAFSPDGKRLVTGGEDGTLRSWDVLTGLPLRTAEGHGGDLVWTEFAPDGSLLVSSGTEGETFLRDPETLLAKRALPLHHKVVNSAVFQRTAAGLRLITAAEDRSVRIWDPATATQLSALQGFADNIILATLSPSGKRLLILAKDGVVRLWDMQAEMPLAVLPSFDDDLTTAAYAPPDGRYFLLGSANGFVRIYADDYAANLAGTLTDACNLLRHQPEFESVRTYCP